MPSAKDRFYDYLDYCDKNGPIGIGDYIEKVAPREVLGWTRLLRDLLDTFQAGKLVKVKSDNGSASYVTPEIAAKYKKEGTYYGHVR